MRAGLTTFEKSSKEEQALRTVGGFGKRKKDQEKKKIAAFLDIRMQKV